MDIEQLITPERVRCESDIGDKEQALLRIGELIGASGDGLDAREISNRLLARERLGSTGLGHGVAVPHARIDGIDRAIGALVRLERGIEFDAFDKAPVDLLFALVVPEHFTDEHLQILASLAEMFSDSGLCERLRVSADGEELQAALREWQSQADPS